MKIAARNSLLARTHLTIADAACYPWGKSEIVESWILLGFLPLF